jgi:alanine racemase
LNFRPTRAIIRLDFLKQNFKILKALNNNLFICPMVKANAYGHGSVEVSNALIQAGATHLGVALVEEALVLRQQKINSDILVFGGFDNQSVNQIVQHKLTPVIGTLENLKMLSMAGVAVNIHLKIDTGMHRMGILPEQVEQAITLIKNSGKINLVGLATHLLSGHEASSSEAQLQKFDKALLKFQNTNMVKHVFNSTGLLCSAKNHIQYGSRPGILLYGPCPNLPQQQLSQFKQVMTLRTKVIRYHHLRPGDTVSYGATWTAQQESIIAVLPVGYADGVKRSLSNKGTVLFKNQKAKIVGTVCMDYTMIDVTHIVGSGAANSIALEEVTIFGYDSDNHFISVQEMAEAAGTISYEMMTGLGGRVPREFVQ